MPRIAAAHAAEPNYIESKFKAFVVTLSVGPDLSVLYYVPFCAYSWHLIGFTPYILFNDEGDESVIPFFNLVKETITSLVPSALYFAKNNLFDYTHSDTIPHFATLLAGIYMPMAHFLLEGYTDEEVYLIASDSPDVVVTSSIFKYGAGYFPSAGNKHALNLHHYSCNYIGMSLWKWRKIMQYDGLESMRRDFLSAGGDVSISDNTLHSFAERIVIFKEKMWSKNATKDEPSCMTIDNGGVYANHDCRLSKCKKSDSDYLYHNDRQSNALLDIVSNDNNNILFKYRQDWVELKNATKR